MAEEQERRGGFFGGRGSLREDLKDINQDEKRNFGDTWLGDLLGADGKFGVQGPGLRSSWFGARRDGPGSEANLPNMEDLTEDDLKEIQTRRSMRSYYPESGGDGLRDPNPLGEVTYGPQNGRGRRRVVEAPQEANSAPQVGDTAPTMGSPSVGPESVALGSGTERVPLVPRPQPLPGVVDENAPTISNATSYPLASSLERLLGKNSPFVTQALPRILETQLTGGAQNDINNLYREVYSLPDSQTKAEVLNELGKMRDRIRGGGGGY